MLGLNPEAICSLLTIFFLSYYARENVYPNFFNFFNFFNLFSVLMSSQVIITDEVITDQVIAADQTSCEKEEIKYEDKFLDAIRQMDNEYIFDENETEIERNKFDELLLLAQEEYNKKVNDVKDRIASIERIIKFNDSSDDEFCTVEYNENSENSQEDDHIKNLTEEKLELEKVLAELEKSQDINKLRLETCEKARQFVIDERENV